MVKMLFVRSHWVLAFKCSADNCQKKVSKSGKEINITGIITDKTVPLLYEAAIDITAILKPKKKTPCIPPHENFGRRDVISQKAKSCPP